MASIYNDVVSSRRGSRALPWCHSRFVLCSSMDWIAALRMPRLPCWDRLGHVCCANRDELRGQDTGQVWQLPHPVGGYQLGHTVPEGTAISQAHDVRFLQKDVLGANQPPGAARKGREEHGYKALVHGKGRCKQGRERSGDSQTLARCLGQETKWQSDQNREKQHPADPHSCLN